MKISNYLNFIGISSPLVVSLIMALANLYLQYDDINDVLLLISGVIINIGSLVQFLYFVFKRKNLTSIWYLRYLFIGCLILFICQMYLYIINNSENMLPTLITTSMSLFTSFLLNCIFYFNRKERKIYFLEGTCCVGKTTISDISIDFLKYVKEAPIFA